MWVNTSYINSTRGTAKCLVSSVEAAGLSVAMLSMAVHFDKLEEWRTKSLETWAKVQVTAQIHWVCPSWILWTPQCTDITLGTPCSDILLGTPRSDIALGTPCSDITLGTPCSGILLGTPRSDITLGTPCSDIILGTPCSDIILGTPCSDITLATPCSDITLGTPHSDIMHGTPHSNITLGSNYPSTTWPVCHGWNAPASVPALPMVFR